MTVRPGRVLRRRSLMLFGVYSAAGVASCLLWIFFSYLFVPIESPTQMAVPHWPLDGYYTYRPGTYENDLRGVTYTINSSGFRGPEFAAAKSRYRIICVGESSTAGIESPDQETWPARLQQYLGTQVEVINAGVGGSTSREHRAMFRRLLGYDPDLILYYAGINDHSIARLERYPGPDVWPAGRLNFIRHWFLYKRVQLRMLLLPVTDIERWVTWSNGWAQTYQENLTAMYSDSLEAEVPFVVISQVLKNMTSPMSFRTDAWHLLLRQQDGRAIQQQLVPPERFLDVRPAFASMPAGLFYDPVHLTPRGNEVLAEAVAAALQERGMVPK